MISNSSELLTIDGQQFRVSGPTLVNVSHRMGMTVDQILAKYQQSGGALCPEPPPCVVKQWERLLWWPVDDKSDYYNLPTEVLYYKNGLNRSPYQCFVNSSDSSSYVQICNDADLFKVDVTVNNILVQTQKKNSDSLMWEELAEKNVYEVTRVAYFRESNYNLNISVYAKLLNKPTSDETVIWTDSSFTRGDLVNSTPLAISKKMEDSFLFKATSEHFK